ncbi:hypothetical protein MBLNU457_7225t1 [Dothideomycetes sp. NU457]
MAPSRSILFLGAVTFALFLERFAPEYALFHSRWPTMIVAYLTAELAMATWRILLWPYFFSPLRHLPQPKGNSIFMGQFYRILKEPSGVPQREWMETIPNDGLIYYRSMFNSERVMVTSPKGLSEALSTKSYDLIKPKQLVQGIGRILGVGVLLAEGDEHKRQRKNLMPAFTYRHVKDLYPIFWDLTREMVLAIDKSLSEPPKTEVTDEKPTQANVVRVDEWASRSTLDIIGVAGIGKSFNAIEDENSQLYQVYQSIFRQDSRTRLIGFLLPIWLVTRLPLKQNHKVEAARTYIRKMCLDVIKEKKAKIAAAAEKGESDSGAGVDILTVALKSGGFTDEECIDQLMTFLAAGHETTASAMTWALLVLCQHPSIQTRLRTELRASDLPNIRDKHATITAEQIDKLPYLSAVINEVLRFHPPVPLTIRVAGNDTTLLGNFIPKDTTIIYSPVATNRYSSFWGEDSDTFNPDRWLGSGKANGGADSNYANMTFLHGPRSCIGQGFSKAEFACLLAGWVMAFDSELADPEAKVEVQGGVTQRPKGGLACRIKVLDG